MQQYVSNRMKTGLVTDGFEPLRLDQYQIGAAP
jgi:hypothetical protein